MHEYHARFWRYLNGQGRISAPLRIMATDFRHATDQAHLILEGMKSIAQPNRYAKAQDHILEIHTIEMSGARAERCEDQLNIWATADEVATRREEAAK